MATTQEEVVPGAQFEAADRHLRKPMGFNHLLFLSLGAIIGSGWLFGSLKAAYVAGPRGDAQPARRADARSPSDAVRDHGRHDDRA